MLKEGEVAVNDTLQLVKKADNSLTVTQLFNLVFNKNKNQEHLAIAIENTSISESKHNKLKAFIK